MRCKMWIVTAPWYDKRNLFALNPWHTKRAAIHEILLQFPESNWAKLKRDGWRCAACTISWSKV